jgi:hypothetical protein
LIAPAPFAHSPGFLRRRARLGPHDFPGARRKGILKYRFFSKKHNYSWLYFGSDHFLVRNTTIVDVAVRIDDAKPAS